MQYSHIGARKRQKSASFCFSDINSLGVLI